MHNLRKAAISLQSAMRTAGIAPQPVSDKLLEDAKTALSEGVEWHADEGAEQFLDTYKDMPNLALAHKANMLGTEAIEMLKHLDEDQLRSYISAVQALVNTIDEDEALEEAWRMADKAEEAGVDPDVPMPRMLLARIKDQVALAERKLEKLNKEEGGNDE